MYSDDNLVYVFTMLECCEKTFLYAEVCQTAEELVWLNDQREFNAVWALMLVIGEESKKLETGLKDEFTTIPWRTIAAMRNFLAHDYRGIDHERVWEVLRDSLPELKECLITMIDRIRYDDGIIRRALDSPYYRHIQYLRNKLV